MDGRETVYTARGDWYRPHGKVVYRRGGRCTSLEPQRAAQEGFGRCHDRALPERRATHAGQRLSNAPTVARLRRQLERQVLAADQARRRAGDELLGDQDLYAAPSEREGIPVLFSAGGEVLHHPPLPGTDIEGARAIRDFRYRLFGDGPDLQGNDFGRWRTELGGSSAAGTGPEQGLYPVPYALALGRLSSNVTKPGLGRGGQCAADSRTVRGRARRVEESSPCGGRPEPALQLHHKLGGRREGAGQACLCLDWTPPPPCLYSSCAEAGRRPKGRISESPWILPASRRGTSAFSRTVPTCRQAAARPLKARGSMLRSARPATVWTGKAVPRARRRSSVAVRLPTSRRR